MEAWNKVNQAFVILIKKKSNECDMISHNSK